MTTVTDVKSLANTKFSGRPFIEQLDIEVWDAANAVKSSVFNKNNVGNVLVCLENGTNASITVTLEAALTADFAKAYTLTETVTAAAGANGFVLLSAPWAYVRGSVKPSVAVASGECSLFVVDGAGRHN